MPETPKPPKPLLVDYPQDEPTPPTDNPQSVNPLTIHTESGAVSWSQVTNIAFLVLWCLLQLANAFGFQSYEPPTEMLVIMPAIIAIVNILLRKYHTREPLA
jgi:hypothetical protein